MAGSCCSVTEKAGDRRQTEEVVADFRRNPRLFIKRTDFLDLLVPPGPASGRLLLGGERPRLGSEGWEEQVN